MLFLALVLALGAVASHRHRARTRCPAPAAPVVVRKSAWGPGRPKTVRPAPAQRPQG